MARRDDIDSGTDPTPQRATPRPPTGGTSRKPPTRPRPADQPRPAPTRPVPDGDELDEDFHGRWERLHTDQLDIEPRDSKGHVIGPASVIRKIAKKRIGGWKPMDDSKQVLVGDFDHYGFYDPPHHVFDWKGRIAGPFVADEADFNIFITPDPPYRHLLDDVIAKMSRDERKELHQRRRAVHRGTGAPSDDVDGLLDPVLELADTEREVTPNEEYCIECEVTPDEEYYGNRWFPTRKPFTALGIGEKIGVYGPWVRDLAHGGRPEIHPCEVIWTANGSFDSPGRYKHAMWKILVVQDDSNRFDRITNYNGVPWGPLRPWSASPRFIHITMAVRARREARTFYDIHVADGHHVFEHPGEQTRSITRSYGGRPALTVTKRTSRPSQLKVRLSGLRRDPDDSGLLRGLLEIDVQVGENDRGKEGFAELRVEHFVQPAESDSDDAPPPAPPTPPPPPAPSPSPRPPGNVPPGPDDPPRHEP